MYFFFKAVFTPNPMLRWKRSIFPFIFQSSLLWYTCDSCWRIWHRLSPQTCQVPQVEPGSTLWSSHRGCKSCVSLIWQQCNTANYTTQCPQWVLLIIWDHCCTTTTQPHQDSLHLVWTQPNYSISVTHFYVFGFNYCPSDLGVSECRSTGLLPARLLSGLWLTARCTPAVQLRSSSTGAARLPDLMLQRLSPRKTEEIVRWQPQHTQERNSVWII